MIKDTYDIAIIGAGPAGSVFAKELINQRPDLSILLVDGQSERNKKVCGGLLAPDAQRMFAKFALTLPTGILSDPQIFDVETVDLEKRCVRNYQRHYLNMDRYAFDKWLLSLVPDAVCVYSGRCSNIYRAGDHFKLKLSESEVRTRYIVGADGANSIVRKTFFNDKITKYVSIQQHFPSSDHCMPPYSCIFDEKTSDSCSWTIRKDGYIIFGGAFNTQNCRQAFETQKERFEKFIGVNFGEPSKTEACLVISPRKMKDFNIGGKNVFLIGEAAGFISASSFEGISSALISARLLAEAFGASNNENDIIRHYRRNTLKLKFKLYFKIQKRRVLCSPFLRALIMKSGIQSVKKFK